MRVLVKVPVIDFQPYDEEQTDSPDSLSNEVELALSQIGFMSVTNLGIDKQLLDHPARYSPITAGEHLQEKIQASHTHKFEQ
jgi:isopenicillin N synthase-like dioxygenase